MDCKTDKSQDNEQYSSQISINLIATCIGLMSRFPSRQIEPLPISYW